MAGLLRDYLWLWVVLVVLLLATIISMIFICLNRWITCQGKLILSLDSRPPASLQKHPSPIVQSAPSVKLSTPPLPPRTQFVNEVSLDRSYESLADGPDYEDPDENLGQDYQMDHRSSLPEYLMLESEPGPDPQNEEEEQGNSDYDDITAEDEKEDEKEDEDEDYDDVG